MNKFLAIGLIAGAGALMASCSKDASNSDFSQNAIEFGTYLGRDAQTKGAVTNNTLLQASGFGVTAFYTGQKSWNDFGTETAPNFMYNQQVKYSNSAWSYSPVKYWPTTVGDKISFFAYAPMAAESNNSFTLSENSVAGTPTITVTYPTDLTKMVDLVAGVAMNKTKAKGNATEDVVTFTLKHEMSRVGIFAKVDKAIYDANNAANKTFVVIKSVKFDKAVTDGQFYTSATYTFSNEDGTNGSWDIAHATKASEDVNLSALLNTKTVQATDAKVGTKYNTGVTGIKLSEKDKAVSLFKENDYLFLIPVFATAQTENNSIKATATISYDIVTEDSKLAEGYSCTSATKTVSLPAGTLVQGKAYNYVFTIKLDEVKLSATVTDWETATDDNVDVNYTDTDVK